MLALKSWKNASNGLRVFYIVGIVVVLAIIGSVLPNTTENSVQQHFDAPASASQSKEPQESDVETDLGKTDQERCDGHLFAKPDGAHEEIDWESDYSRIENEDGSVTYYAPTLMLDNRTSAKYKGGLPIECTIKEGEVISFKHIERMPVE